MQRTSYKTMLKEMGRGGFWKDIYGEMNDDNVFNGAAALSYYWLLAIFPAAIFLLSLLPYLPIPDLEQAIMDLLRQAMPQQASDMFTGIVRNITSQKRGGLLSFGILFTLWAASTGVYAIMQQLNITYDVKEERPFWKARGVAILLMLLVFVLIIGAFALVIFGGVIQDWIASVVGNSAVLSFLFAFLRWIIILCFLLLGFALLYYLGPDTEQRFRFVSPGSLLAMIVLILASLAFRFYVANFANYSATYGSLGAVIILMLWLYILGLVILFGSEVNAILEHRQPQGKQKGEKAEPG